MRERADESWTLVLPWSPFTQLTDWHKWLEQDPDISSAPFHLFGNELNLDVHRWLFAEKAWVFGLPYSHTPIFNCYVWKLGVSNVVEIHPFNVKYRWKISQSHKKSFYLYFGGLVIWLLCFFHVDHRIYHPFQFIKSLKLSTGAINKYAQPWIGFGWKQLCPG